MQHKMGSGMRKRKGGLEVVFLRFAARLFLVKKLPFAAQRVWCLDEA